MMPFGLTLSVPNLNNWLLPLCILINGIIILACKISFTYAAHEESFFLRDVALDGRLCDVSERVASVGGVSTLACGRICQEDSNCLSFFYDEDSATCHGCDRDYTPSSFTLAVPGMVYYRKYIPAPTTTLAPTTTTTTLAPTTTTTTLPPTTTTTTLPPTTTTTTLPPTTTTTTLQPTTTTTTLPPTSTCLDILATGAPSGVYAILTPITFTPVSVYCDMDTEGGGWMVWQHRFVGTVDFESKTFAEYENGFGDPAGEYWLGLKHLQEFLASRTSSVYLQFTDFSDVVVYEWFDNMQLSAGPQYNLALGSFISSNDGSNDNGFRYNDLQPFSSRHNVQNSATHCPIDYAGAWWYSSCTRINPNGRYGVAGNAGAVHNYNMEWHNYDALKATKLMIREV